MGVSSKNNGPDIQYQGVFTDPKHPKGYRVLIGNGKSASMQLQDDPKGELYSLPVKVKMNSKTKVTELSFDFSPKGGPKDIVATLGGSGDTTTLTFPDGNIWKQNTGVEGVYKDGLNPKKYRIIRKDKGSTLAVELKNDLVSESVSISAKSSASKKAGVQVKFDFPGKKGDVGSFKDNTISFADGNVWTKY